ncbi:hypothetical protein [Chryseobacterium sp. JV274]|nr:hypothetical protein [Chryseobacterium sp. JV274]
MKAFFILSPGFAGTSGSRMFCSRNVASSSAFSPLPTEERYLWASID